MALQIFVSLPKAEMIIFWWLPIDIDEITGTMDCGNILKYEINLWKLPKILIF